MKSREDIGKNSVSCKVYHSCAVRAWNLWMKAMPFFCYLHSLLMLIPLSLQLNEFNPMGDTLASVMGECT